MKLVKVYQRHPLHKAYVYVDTIGTGPVAEALTRESDGSNDTFTSIGSGTATTAALTQILTTVNGLMENVTEKIIALIPSDQYGMLNQPNTALFCKY